MKTFLFGCAAALSLLPGCSGNSDEPASRVSAPAADELATTEVTALVEEYFDRYLELNPLTATRIGDDRYDDRLANWLSPEHRARSRALDQEYLDRLREIDAGVLEGQDLLTYATFRFSRELRLEGYDFPAHLQPVHQFFSVLIQFARLGSGASFHPFKSVKNYDDFLSRVDDFVVIVDQAIVNMRLGMQEGVVQPRVLMEKVLPQLKSQFAESTEKSAFFGPIQNMPESFGAEDRQRLAQAYKRAIEEKIIPAYRGMHAFISNEYLAAARDTVGYSALPNGEAWYDYLVRFRTTTELSPAEIHRIGLAEVERIQGEMRSVMRAVEFDGDLNQFFEFMNNDDQFYFDQPNQLVQGYRDMSERISNLAPKLFSLFPKAGFEVRRLERFREQTASAASYMRPTADGSRPGVFYVNGYDIKARPKWEMEALFLHEAIPGHHFQLAIQQELEGVPRFRRFGGYTAFIEGWGLYAESLGKELGVYNDPYQYFGALNMELWRAIRLVVDTGIHAMGWSRQQVLDYMYANSAVKEAEAVSSADRYIAWPGQALAYKIGELKFRELRNRAEQRLGEQFDVRGFHTALLIDGPLPLDMLDAKVDRWVDAASAANQ